MLFSRHPTYNMEVFADFGGSTLLSGTGSVSLQSEWAAHRPTFWLLVRSQQNHEIYHPFLQSL